MNANTTTSTTTTTTVRLWTATPSSNPKRFEDPQGWVWATPEKAWLVSYGDHVWELEVALPSVEEGPYMFTPEVVDAPATQSWGHDPQYASHGGYCFRTQNILSRKKVLSSVSEELEDLRARLTKAEIKSETLEERVRELERAPSEVNTLRGRIDYLQREVLFLERVRLWGGLSLVGVILLLFVGLMRTHSYGYRQSVEVERLSKENQELLEKLDFYDSSPR